MKYAIKACHSDKTTIIKYETMEEARLSLCSLAYDYIIAGLPVDLVGPYEFNITYSIISPSVYKVVKL